MNKGWLVTRSLSNDTRSCRSSKCSEYRSKFHLVIWRRSGFIEVKIFEPVIEYDVWWLDGEPGWGLEEPN